jgi:cytochrome c biogenesis protein CcmG/thiol:disulfide interchange protein DsbE
VKRPGVLPSVVIVLSAALIALIIYGVVNTGADTSLDAAARRGEQPVAPGASVALPRLDGDGSISLAQLRGKVVVLNFWASWCEPCKAEAPVLERAQQRLTAAGAGTVLGATYKDFATESRRFERQQGVTYPSVRDDQLKLAPKYGTTKLPETFVIDRQGRIVAISRGQIDEKFLSAALDRALKVPAP